MKLKRKLQLFFALFGVFVLVFYLVFEFSLYPLIEKTAIAEGRNLATVVINDAVYGVLESGLLGDGEFVRLVRDDEGSVVSLESNSDRINRAKALISREIEKRLGDEALSVSVPLGNVTGIKLLSGLGPSVKIKTLPVRSVTTDIVSVFSQSGINQTWHRILLQVDADFGVMVLSRTLECRISDSILLSDTVIVGRVPDAYTDINKIEDELLGDVVDFSAGPN